MCNTIYSDIDILDVLPPAQTLPTIGQNIIEAAYIGWSRYSFSLKHDGFQPFPGSVFGQSALCILVGYFGRNTFPIIQSHE